MRTPQLIWPQLRVGIGGAEAQILTDGGGSSALAGLTENDGMLLLRGDSIYGAGGASLTTTAPFTNVDTTDVDHLKGAAAALSPSAAR